jgi:hypothetical protein
MSLIITRKLKIETLLKEFEIKIEPFGAEVAKIINLEDYDEIDIYICNPNYTYQITHIYIVFQAIINQLLKMFNF